MTQDVSADGDVEIDGGHVELDVPLNARHAGTVRAVAAAFAADARFSIDDIDDLRLGVNEAVSLATDVDAAPSARLQVRFERDGADGVVVHVRRFGVDEPLAESLLDDLAVRILGAVVDDYAVRDGIFVIVKRRA